MLAPLSRFRVQVATGFGGSGVNYLQTNVWFLYEIINIR
jgi:hypothetical protein